MRVCRSLTIEEYADLPNRLNGAAWQARPMVEVGYVANYGTLPALGAAYRSLYLSSSPRQHRQTFYRIQANLLCPFPQPLQPSLDLLTGPGSLHLRR